MKRFLLTMLVLLTAIVAVNAQNGIAVGKVEGLGATDKKPIKISALKSGNSQNAMKSYDKLSRMELDANERLCGYYTSDELKYGIYFTYYAGDHTVGSIFSTSDVLKKAVGGTITKARVAFYKSIGSTTVNVYSLSGSSMSSEPIATGTISSTVSGWNDVTFDKPITIVDGEDYLVTYDFTLANMQGGIGQTVLITDTDLNDYNPKGIYLLGNYGPQGEGLYYYDTSCDLCIQLVVQGGSFIDDDVTLNKPSLEKIFYKSGDEPNFSFGVRSTGNNIPSSYSLDVAIDGQVVKTLNSPVQLTGSTQIVKTSVTLPSGYAAGDLHEITVKVKDINGAAATENVDDDMVGAGFKSYVESLSRQKNYVEQYTSTECGWCPYGSDAISALKEKRSDIAVVAMHNSIMDQGSYVDPLTIDRGDAISKTFASGLPSGTVNRYYVMDETINNNGSLALTLTSSTDPQIEAQILSDAIDESNASVPAFATVDISTSYNKDTRELSVTVSGKAVNDFNKLVGSDAALTVCLTEDGVTSQQYKYPLSGASGSYVNDYVHNSVLRAVVNENTYGDALEWTDATNYSKTYNVTLDDSWNAENMNVVAFIGRPITENSYIDDVWVNNANIVKVGETSTGINNAVTETDENATEVARYALDGTQLSVPTKGVNIVKMSDGTTKKVIVK